MNDIRRQRKAMRFRKYDYTSCGAYFVTICTNQRIPYFRDKSYKNIAEQTWNDLPRRFPSLRLDALAILPDHIHGILWLEPTEKNAPSLLDIIGTYKSLVYHNCIHNLRQNTTENIRTIWQKTYYDRILDTEPDLERTRLYILNNFAKHIQKGDYPADWANEQTPNPPEKS
jgi:REP element-mobilizing transposase RayT